MKDGNGDPAAMDQQDLIVWCDDAEAGSPLVAGLRQRFSIDGAGDLEAFEARIAGAPEARGLLLYLSPVETLCRAMAADILPTEALGAWQARAEEILALNRRDRRRIRLLEISTGRANPKMFQQHFSLPEAEILELPPQDRVLSLIASRVLNADPGARRLQGELEAASLDCTAGARGADDPDAAFRAYRAISRAYQQAELLESQTRLVREEMSVLAGQKSELEAALATAENNWQQARQDVDLLKAQNRAVQEELEAAARDKLKLESTLEATEQDGQKARKEADLLQAQVRLMTQEMETLSAERRQLDQRLEQMSQGLESYQTQLSALSAERDRLAKRAGEKERSLATAGAALREAEAQRNHLAARLEEVQAERAAALGEARARASEVERILASKSFRLMAPLRRLRALLSGGGVA